MRDVSFRRSPTVLWRSVGDDALVAVPAGGEPELLSGTAAEIWRLLDVPRSARELAERLAGRYEARVDTVADDVASFLADLRGRGYVDEVGAHRA